MGKTRKDDLGRNLEDPDPNLLRCGALEDWIASRDVHEEIWKKASDLWWNLIALVTHRISSTWTVQSPSILSDHPAICL